ALVIGTIPSGAHARYADRDLLITPDNHVVFGVGRDEQGPVACAARERDARHDRIEIAVTPRDWPVERIEGVPPATVEPPPDIAERIKKEQARVVAPRHRDYAREHIRQTD